MTSTILATFDTKAHAEAAVQELVSAGFNRTDIGVASYDATSHDPEVVIDGDVDGAEGAGFGATFGTLLGAAVGLAAITIPGIGPVIAAGPLAAAFGAAAGAGIGAVSGAVTGGITASLVNLGVPDEHAHYYAESLRRGSVMVSVSAEGTDVDRAMSILRNHHPIDLDKRVAEWRNDGWSGFDGTSDPVYPTASDVNSPRHDDEIPADWTEDDLEKETTGAPYRYPTTY